jgi:hypothetical protein
MSVKDDSNHSLADNLRIAAFLIVLALIIAFAPIPRDLPEPLLSVALQRNYARMVVVYYVNAIIRSTIRSTEPSEQLAHKSQEPAPASDTEHSANVAENSNEQQSPPEESKKSEPTLPFISFAPHFALPPPPPAKIFDHTKGKKVHCEKKSVDGIPFFETVVDLQDPETFLAIGLAKDSLLANDNVITHGDEEFGNLIRRNRGAVVVNGTFFSKDNQKRVMGNMVSGGRFLKYSRWEDMGTTLGLKEGNKPEMITARLEGKPRWDDYWFSITCGPRLVNHGQIKIDATKEGFQDSHVLGGGPRAALGFTALGDKLYIITFLRGLTLQEEAKAMRDIGCYEAMNLDGGASKALAVDGEVIVAPGRPLTNVLVVYDSLHKAPQQLIDSWDKFQLGVHPSIP